jgi:hypothetical protein
MTVHQETPKSRIAQRTRRRVWFPAGRTKLPEASPQIAMLQQGYEQTSTHMVQQSLWSGINTRYTRDHASHSHGNVLIDCSGADSTGLG